MQCVRVILRVYLCVRLIVRVYIYMFIVHILYATLMWSVFSRVRVLSCTVVYMCIILSGVLVCVYVYYSLRCISVCMCIILSGVYISVYVYYSLRCISVYICVLFSHMMYLTLSGVCSLVCVCVYVN
jgi:hypothetical protein